MVDFAQDRKASDGPVGSERGDRSRTRERPFFTWFAVFVVGCLIAADRPGIWFVIVTLFLGAALAHLAGWRARELRIVALALATTVAAVDYLAWRTTVVSLAAWFIAIPLLLAELHAALHTVGLQFTMWPRHSRPRPHPAHRDPHLLPVFIFVPTVDEGVEIVGQTLAGVLAARDRYREEHPLVRVEIVVCNDGGVAGAACSDGVIDLCDRLGVQCITRSVGGGAKAGNIEHARRVVDAVGSALLVIFDADQVPRADFLTATISAFSDPTVGWVQTGQFYRNRSNPVARWSDDQQSLFYRLLCPAKSAQNAAFMCGTNLVINAVALDEIGGFPQDSVTEDFAASVFLAPRWRSVYVPGVFATGIGPMDITAYLKQQERWARGTLTVLRKHWKVLFRPSSGLSLSQRLQYGLAMTHYLAGVRDLVFVVAPVLFIVGGVSGVKGATAADFLQHFVPYFALTLVAFWHVAAPTTSWRSIVIGFASGPALLKAAWMTAFGRFGKFTITPKARVATSWWRAGRVYLIGLAVCLVTLAVAATWRRGPAVLLAGAWTAYLAVMFGAALALVIADTRHGRRAADSPEEAERAVVRTESSGRIVPKRALGTLPSRVASVVSVAVIVAIGAAIVVEVVPDSPSNAASGPAPSFIPGKPSLGVSGADVTRTSTAASELGVRGPIQGRTFEIADSLDNGWATGVTQRGGVPWITLSFAKNGRRTLNSSLTAITNGVQDDALDRWARAIADFARPVYLTVLAQVDRNYSASTAVAAGGIPSDAAPAWEHIRERFNRIGARNVAWVWGPAEPGRDALYAPPPSSIDALAVAWYEYPKTLWVDPVSELAAAAQRHPGVPILLEISAPPSSCSRLNGEPPGMWTCGVPRVERDDWLAAVAAAVRGRDDIAAVVYHDGGPYSDPADQRATAWRLPDPRKWTSTLLFEG